jgi:nicotinamidase-related amidase
MSVQNIALHIVDIDVLTDVPRHPYHVTLVTDATPDLDMRLKQKGITHVILVGLLANTCTESTGRRGQGADSRGFPKAGKDQWWLV